MRIKYMIHRSKKPFAIQKEVFRRLVSFYQRCHSGLRFIDKGLRFSVYDDTRPVPLELDFDFGYRNMRYRDFSKYHRVISQGCFAILNPNVNPGDIVFPTRCDGLRINGDYTKVRVYDNTSTFQNQMFQAWSHLEQIEERGPSSELKQFVCEEFGSEASKATWDLSTMPIHREGRFIEANTFFLASQLDKATALLKSGEDRLEIPHLDKYLKSRYEGLNLETRQMIDNVGDKLMMFSVGLDKPYEDCELTDELRHAKRLHDYLPTYDDARIAYFQGILFGLLVHPQFQGTLLNELVSV